MLIHNTKCKGLIKAGLLGPRCDKCGKRWGPWAWIWTPGIRTESRAVVTEKKLKKVIDAKIERDKFEGVSGKIREYAPGAAIMADIMPQWRRRYRVAFVLGIISVIGALIWLWKFQ